MAYKKCPRCSLNYIQDTEVLCKICLDEVGKALRSNGEDEEEYDICPECGENIIKAGEDMCYQCMIEQIKDEVDEESRKRKSGRTFLPKDEDDSLEDDQDDALEELEEE